MSYIFRSIVLCVNGCVYWNRRTSHFRISHFVLHNMDFWYAIPSICRRLDLMQVKNNVMRIVLIEKIKKNHLFEICVMFLGRINSRKFWFFWFFFPIIFFQIFFSKIILFLLFFNHFIKLKEIGKDKGTRSQTQKMACK